MNAELVRRKTKPSRAGWVWEENGKRLSGDFAYICRLRALLAVDDLKLNVIAFGEAFVAFAGDAGIMNENIWTVVAADESVPLGVVEPLYLSLDS